MSSPSLFHVFLTVLAILFSFAIAVMLISIATALLVKSFHPHAKVPPDNDDIAYDTTNGIINKPRKVFKCAACGKEIVEDLDHSWRNYVVVTDDKVYFVIDPCYSACQRNFCVDCIEGSIIHGHVITNEDEKRKYC